MLTKRYIIFLIFMSNLCLASSSLLCKSKRCTGEKVSSDFLPTPPETGAENNNGRGSFVLTEVGLNTEGTRPFVFKWHWVNMKKVMANTLLHITDDSQHGPTIHTNVK